MEKSIKDRFFYGYVIVAAGFGIQAIGVGTYISYGAFFDSFTSEFGWSRATISGASSVAFFFMGLLGIFVGRLSDRIGPRKVMTVTGFFFGLGLLLMSRLNAVWQLYLFYGLVLGVGLSSIDVIALSTPARWFNRRRGTMIGIVKVGTGAGQLLIPLTASLLIVSFGWRTSFVVLGAAGLLSLVSIAQLLRRDPSQMGPSPDRGKGTLEENPGLIDEGFSLREALHTRQFWTICTVNMLAVFCLMIIMVHIVPHAQDIGVSVVRAASVLSTIGGVSMAGRLLTGITIDRIGSKGTMMICFVMLIIVLLWLQLADELWMLYLFALVYGIAHGGLFTAVSPVVAEYFGTNAIGVLVGFVVFGGTVGGAIGPIVAGHIFDVTAAYSLAFWLCTLVSTLGLLLIASLQPTGEMPGAQHKKADAQTQPAGPA